MIAQKDKFERFNEIVDSELNAIESLIEKNPKKKEFYYGYKDGLQFARHIYFGLHH